MGSDALFAAAERTTAAAQKCRQSRGKLGKASGNTTWIECVLYPEGEGDVNTVKMKT